MQKRWLSCGFFLATACVSQGRPCSNREADCDSELACVVNRCRPKAEAVVPAESRRVVIPARRVAVLASRELPVDAEVTAFGAAASGDVIVLLDFDAGVTSAVEVTGAFLVVDPEVGSPGPAAPVSVALSPVLGTWNDGFISYGRAPRLGSPLTKSDIPPARRAALRLDVTEFVAKNKLGGQRFALTASGDDPIGARLVTLAESSVGPRLELYLK